MRVTVLPCQTLADISLQVYGTIEVLPLLADANGMSMSADLEPGTELDCPDVVIDQYLQNYAQMNDIKPATK